MERKLNRELVVMNVDGERVEVVILNPSDGAWCIVTVKAGRFPPLPHRESSYPTREAVLAAAREIARKLLA